MIPLHMGSLHAYEQALVLVLAFGPFVVLGIVVWLRRRADAAVPEGDSQLRESSSGTAHPVDGPPAQPSGE
ncbi:MAG TPA: hypothetical protein VEW73_11575 [Nocardioides sp.]|jgi:uncharacterized iron-regulated membrane protein|nr:hypothetical protein [Nocardioides sp.]